MPLNDIFIFQLCSINDHHLLRQLMKKLILSYFTISKNVTMVKKIKIYLQFLILGQKKKI